MFWHTQNELWGCVVLHWETTSHYMKFSPTQHVFRHLPTRIGKYISPTAGNALHSFVATFSNYLIMILTWSTATIPTCTCNLHSCELADVQLALARRVQQISMTSAQVSLLERCIEYVYSMLHWICVFNAACAQDGSLQVCSQYIYSVSKSVNLGFCAQSRSKSAEASSDLLRLTAKFGLP